MKIIVRPAHGGRHTDAIGAAQRSGVVSNRPSAVTLVPRLRLAKRGAWQSQGALNTMKLMKSKLFLLPALLLLAGCATTSTIQSREQERAAAYASFSPEVKALVNQGRIAVGMTPDAVYIAWGKPDEVLQSGNQNGEFTTWVYRGAFLEETRYWVGRRFPHLEHDYEPRSYVRAEIVFANGVVQSWRTLPEPNY